MSDLDVKSFVENLDSPLEEGEENIFETEEIIVDQKTGKVRQAGTDGVGGEFIQQFKDRAEKSLYFFSKSFMGRDRLTPALHKPICDWFSKVPPHRKLLLLPRDHYKTTIASQCLPIHLVIQSPEKNIYFPGKSGTDTRILLACESEQRASNHLRWIESRFEGSKYLRALWPHCCWDNPRRQSKKWNEQAMLLPRINDYSDPTIQVKGVGGVITGAHVDVMIKDDIISLEAANSVVVMQTAIEWHIASRALFDHPDLSLEFIIGTRWAVFDLYSYIMDNDPTVSHLTRSIIENGEPILPELFSKDTIKRLQKEFGVLFPLLYMNSASDPELTDFNPEELREFEISDSMVIFSEDERDYLLVEKIKLDKIEVPDESLRGQKLTPEVMAKLTSRDRYLRLKAT